MATFNWIGRGRIGNPESPRAWSKEDFWLKGDFSDPEIFIPTDLQLNSYGQASVLKIRLRCRCDEVSDYAKPNDPFELWAGSGRSARCLFRGRMVSEDINGETGDSGGIVCLDAIHELDDEFVYVDVRDVTAAYLLRGLWDGLDIYHSGFGSLHILDPKIPEDVCEIGDDLSVLDTKKIDVSFSGRGVVSFIANIFNQLGGNFIWWIEPNQDGSNSQLRFVERGEGASRRLSVGVDGSGDNINVSFVSGVVDYTDVRNEVIGWGGHKRYQKTTAGPSEEDTVSLRRGWLSNGGDDYTDIEQQVMEKPGLCAKSDLRYRYCARRFVINNSLETWQRSNVLFQRLKSEYLRYQVDGDAMEIADDDLQLLVRYPNMVYQSEDPEEPDISPPGWRPYTGSYKLMWEHPPEENLRARTKAGAYNFRPGARTLPTQVILLLDAPAVYDRYADIRTIDNASSYPSPERTDIAEFALTYSYQENTMDESTAMGRLQAKIGKRGPFPRSRKHLFQGPQFIYEKIDSSVMTFDEDGAEDEIRRTYELRDDRPKFMEVLTDIAEVSAFPEKRMAFTLSRCDPTFGVGQTIAEVDNLFNGKAQSLVVESIGIQIKNAKMTLKTADEVMRI